MTIFGTQSATAENAVAQSKQALNVMFQAFVRAYKCEFDTFWRNPQFTPQQMAEAWGVQGLTLFQNSAATKGYILTIDPTALTAEYIDPPQPITFEMDNGAPTGRVVIG